MTESKRQKQIGNVIQQDLSDIFQRLGLSVVDGGMISISSVKMTPDLLEARIYLSFFKINDQEAMLEKVKERSWEIKKALVTRIKNQVRRIPELAFYIDDTLDYVFKMEEIFKKIHKDEEK